MNSDKTDLLNLCHDHANSSCNMSYDILQLKKCLKENILDVERISKHINRIELIRQDMNKHLDVFYIKNKQNDKNI